MILPTYSIFMTERNRGVVRMQFGDGSELSSWLSFKLRDTFIDPIGSLEFDAAPPRAQIVEYRERLKKGELVSILVNEANQGTFIIQERRTTVGIDGVTFHITCQTPLVTPYQGSVNPKISIKTGTDSVVSSVVLTALSAYGFDLIAEDPGADIDAITGRALSKKAAKIPVDRLTQQEAQAHDGETAYGFCSRIFSRLGVALRMSAEGVLLLVVPDYEQEIAYTLVQDFDGRLPGNRFLADPLLEIIDTNDGQFSECTVRGVRADAPGTRQTSTPQVTVTAAELNPTRPAYSSVGAAHKPLIIKDKNARDVQRCRSVAKLALGIRAARAFVVSGYVDGLISQTGRVWSVNTMAHVTIVAEDLDEDMWVLSRELMGDKNLGQLTRLEIIPKGALVLGEIPS